jgi:hypothetical protein
MAEHKRFAEDSEHDWGVMIFAGYAFEWQIEYRGPDGTGLSPDPANPEKTLRVLTLYIAEDLLAKTNPLVDAAPARDHHTNATPATGTRLR